MNDFLPRLLESGSIMSLSSSTVLVAWGHSQSFSQAEDLHLDRPAFYFPDFFLTAKQPWIQYSDWRLIEVENFLLELGEDRLETSFNWSAPDQSIFRQIWDNLQEQFARQCLVKAVPYAFSYQSKSMTHEQLKSSLKSALRSAQRRAGSIYGCWNSSEGILGVTPELLFALQQGIVQTMAVAGTADRERDLEGFKQDPKELHEHTLVVEGISQVLAPFGQLQIGELEVLQLPKLNHLKTSIECQLNQFVSFEKLIHLLHPTPALGAFPREFGLEWLRYHQTLVERGRHGAPAGILWPKTQQGSALVAIRNVQWDKHGQKIGAGCGVVKESTFEREWKEINLKIQAIRHLLAL